MKNDNNRVKGMYWYEWKHSLCIRICNSVENVIRTIASNQLVYQLVYCCF